MEEGEEEEQQEGEQERKEEKQEDGGTGGGGVKGEEEEKGERITKSAIQTRFHFSFTSMLGWMNQETGQGSAVV